MNFWNELREGLTISTSALRANKLRSGLTTLGIVVGIVTVTLMGTAIEGLDKAFKQSVSILGSDVIYIARGGWFVNSYEAWLKVEKRKPITLEQVRQLESQLNMAQAVAPVAESRQPIRYKNRNSGSVFVLGSTDRLQAVNAVGVGVGRFFTESESEGGRPVIVIGTEVATNLFKQEIPLGKSVYLGGKKFEVIGILEAQGKFLGQFSLDNVVMVPIKHFLGNFRRFPDYQIRVKAANPENTEELVEETRAILRKIRRVRPGDEDDFAINRQEELLNTFAQVGGTIASAGLFITGLSLFVGGIGIMNIMFVSVAERTREIGVRKAIGAKRRTILIQFLTEAALICLFGGFIGIAIAWPTTFAISQFLPATMSFKIIGIAILVSLVTGVVSGFFPAWRAARMNPVDALRSE